MKKLIPTLLALSLCVGLVACGGSSSSAPASQAPASQAPASEAPASQAPASEAPASEAPAAKTYTVGICQLIQHAALDAATQGFKDALTEALGENVKFDEQNASGDPATCSTIVSGFATSGVDLIMANATPALQAAVSATTTIPILGTSVTDYGAALSIDGLDASKGTGINVAGSSDGVDPQLYVDLVMDLVPNAKNVSVLYCSAEANSVLQAEGFKACLPEGVNCNIFTFADSNDIQAVVTSAVEGADALYIPTDNQAASNMTIISNVCQNASLPVICGEENMCSNGGLATVSISYYEVGHLCGEQAVQILRDGADVSTLPIAYASDPVKEYNPVYADAIAFTVPSDYIAIGG